MQRKHKVWNWIADRGYYIALGICVLAVGVSAILFVHSLKPDRNQAPEDNELQTVILPTLPASLQTPKPTEEEVPAAALESIVKPGKQHTEPDREDTAPEQPAVSEAPETPAASEEPAQPVRLDVVTPLDGNVIQPYCMDKLSYNATTKDWRTHAGMDIAAPAGSDVRAAADGKVQNVYEDPLLGQTVTIRHAGGYLTSYSNLDPEVSVFVGDAVRSGQTIGTVGKSALLEIGSESHLHFAVYKNNVLQDPEEFLAG